MTIRTDNQGYRRGVVLGFTVAEIVLLFVFCLLLLLAPAVLIREPPQSAELKTIPVDRAPSGQQSGAAAGRPGAQGPDRRSSSAGSPDTAPTTPGAGSPAAEIPPDWDVIVEGGKPRVSQQSLCATAQIRPEECSLQRLHDVMTGRGAHNWPPIIRLREADGEFFAVGRATISDGFAQRIQLQAIPEIERIARQYDVDVIEVVGHTDEQPIQGTPSNLDILALEVLNKGAPPSALAAADNAGLGLARAVAIVRLLRADPRLARFSIIPVSAGHLVDTDGRLADGTRRGDVRERRRIEIRLRRSDGAPRTPGPAGQQ